MKRSHFFIPTQKEVPQDAEIVSHQIMIKGGYIRKTAAGIYTLLPIALKIQKKIENIIRKHMNAAGAYEIYMPVLSPAELWMETGRYQIYGKELMRIKDRHDRDFVLGPTHEEIVTDIVRKNIKSYKELPVCLYQIQTKFRDEVRPRFGIMRGREFTMKDAYSFDASPEKAVESYLKMEKAYNDIFSELELEYSEVEAQSGPIGGSTSKEFMVHASSGEDKILSCARCGYAANIEKAGAKYDNPDEPLKELAEAETRDKKSVEDVAAFMNMKPEKIIKTIIAKTEKGFRALLLRGDRELNTEKAKAALGLLEIVFATEAEIEKITKAPQGFSGPVGLEDIPVIADVSLQGLRNAAAGANKKDMHFLNVNAERDFRVEEYADIAFAKEGDACVKCGGELRSFSGIEVGHIFVLGTKYSKSMSARFLDENGKEQIYHMGCYGIGVGRTMASVIEQKYSQDKGMYWPSCIAPFDAEILVMNCKNEDAVKAGQALYEKMKAAGLDPVIDERNINAGIKFAESDLLGTPFRIVLGNRFLETGKYEVLKRKTFEKTEMTEEEVMALFG